MIANQARRNLNKKKLKTTGFIISMTVISLAAFILFYVVVNINSILMAFKNEITGNFSLEYFELFFKEISISSSVINESLKNTIIFFILANLIIFPCSLLFSYFLYKRIPLFKYYRIVFFLPSIISAVVMTTLYRNILNGPVAEFFVSHLGFTSEPLFFDSTTYALKSIIGYEIWLGFGSNLVIYSGTMARIPQDVIESAKIDGAGFWRELFNFVIPLIWPTLSTLLLLNVIGIFSASGQILLFTQGRYGTYTIAFWIYDKTIVSENYNYASAVGLFFTCIGLPIMLIVRWLLNKLDANVEF